MQGLLIIVLCLAAIGLPVLLGILATGYTRKHRGATRCAACGYELTGIDGRTSLCPECGGRVDGEGALRDGAARFRAMPIWVRLPAILLLMSPTGFVAWGTLALLTDPRTSLMLIVPAFALFAWLAIRVPVRGMVYAAERKKDSVTLTPPGG